MVWIFKVDSKIFTRNL